jgi:hypothetical protein
MKSSFKIFALLALLGVLALAGCETQYPTSYNPSSVSGPSPMIMDFEGAGLAAFSVKSNLTEANRIGNVVQNPGSISVTTSGSVTTTSSGPLTVFIRTPGQAKTAHFFEISGPVTGTTFQLSVNLDTKVIDGKWYYDASFFKGIRFYLKTMPNDNTTSRTFLITTGPTIPTTSQGECDPTLNCYDHFGYTYNGTNGEWKLFSIDFSAFKQQGWGVPTVPSTLSGANLQKFMSLVWSVSSNGGNSLADYCLDEVEFY